MSISPEFKATPPEVSTAILVRELLRLPRETEWLEFKQDNTQPQEIGEYISALANSALIAGRDRGYLVWGINDENHQVRGTAFQPLGAKGAGNEDLVSWLTRLLEPRHTFEFHETILPEGRVVVLEVNAALGRPIRFSGQAYIRIGSYKKPLRDHPDKEQALWRVLDAKPFETRLAEENLSAEQLTTLLDYPAYFQLLQLPLPENREAVLQALAADNLISRQDDGRWAITNLGAILFARHLADFGHLRRKAVRVIRYEGTSRVKTQREKDGTKGYASGFPGLIGYINGLVPPNEIMGKALRRQVPMYPELAVRELVANALIHQDFTITGAGPMVEIFDGRMEITNPGKPLVDTKRFLDSPPRSRNEALAALMRRVGICEERGSGVDKVVFETEFYQLPAPVFEVADDSTRAVLFASRPLSKMDREDKIRACYFHACLRYVNRDFMTNASLRERFGIEAHNTATASRLIKEALTAGMIALFDPKASIRERKYVPYWAAAI